MIVRDMETRATAVIIGVFDGVHLGHQVLLRRMMEVVTLKGLTPTVLTFDPHPEAVLQPGTEPLLLTSIAQKEELMASYGVKRVVHLPFDREFADFSPEEFALYLVGTLAVAWIGVGFNFRFGRGGNGTPQRLAQLGREMGFVVEIFPPEKVGDQTVSSSLIRRLVSEGATDEAARFLGRPYAVRGTVARGDGRGRLLGFPTANMDPPLGQILPPPGIYAVQVRLGVGEWPGAANLGVRPTFHGGGQLRLEVHLLGWEGDLYGREIEVAFLRRLREERKFALPEELQEQVAEDIRKTREVFGL